MVQARIRKHFPPTRDSAAFSLDIDFRSDAPVTVLFGPSGSGKTMTLDSIAGFLRPDAGRILVGDAILFDAEAGLHVAPERRSCGYVFQSYALFPHMTVRGNLEFAVQARPRLERHRRVNDVLERFHLTEVAGRRPHELSGGQKQRCSIARAIVGGPRVLLLDEPSQGLDAALKAELYAELRSIHEADRTPMVLVTHDLAECLELGGYMVVLHEGRVIQAGAPAEVISRPASREAADLFGNYIPIAAEVVRLDPANDVAVLAVDGHEVEGSYLRGKLKGDRVTVLLEPAALGAVARNGRAARNQLPADLERVVATARGVRLEFRQGYRVEMSRDQFEPNARVREWWVEVPRGAVSVL